MQGGLRRVVGLDDETMRRRLVKTIFRITVLPGGIVYGQPIRSNETQSVAENNRASTSCRSHDVPSYFLLSPPPSTISLTRPKR